MNAMTFGRARAVAALLSAALLAGCGGGGGGGTPPAPPTPPVLESNQLLVTVEQNPAIPLATNATVNVPYVTVTLCDTAGHCKSIDHVVVDTGSFGLRVLQSAVAGLSLPADTVVTGSGTASLGECVGFLSGHMWGSVTHATLQMASETTASLPVQVIGASDLPAASATPCNNPGPDVGSLLGIGGNGLLGIGPFVGDAGTYYACSAGVCTALASPPSGEQVANPVASIVNTTDTNGVVLQMPAVPDAGAPLAYGTLSFGVDTQADNSTSGLAAIPLDANGYMVVTAMGTPYPDSFTDSGSNFYFAPLGASIPTDAQQHFIPSSLLTLPITLASAGGAAYSTSLQSQMLIDNYNSMNFAINLAFNDIGAATGSGGVDLGMPFFYGKRVAYVINRQPSALGSGPLVALD